MLELGCGDRRLTPGIARDAVSVSPSTRTPRQSSGHGMSLPAELVSYQVASGKAIELEPVSFDLVVFSWSL